MAGINGGVGEIHTYGIVAVTQVNLEASVRSRGTTVEVRLSAKATSLKPD